MKKLMMCCFLLLLLLPLLARAEDVPTLERPEITLNFPRGRSFAVYSGPGTQYYRAASGKAKVSTNDVIHCFGRAEGNWLLVSYQVSGEQYRIGYIDGTGDDAALDVPRLTFGQARANVDGRTSIFDDPGGTELPLGSVSGAVTVLGWYGNVWAYVEANLSHQPIRGFVLREKLILQENPIALARSQTPAVAVEASRPLDLPEGAKPFYMDVWPLADGTLLLDYRCEDSDKIYLRVIDRQGKKLFAKSVADGSRTNITLSESGFTLEVFRYVDTTGTRYTYACAGRKWKRVQLKRRDKEAFFSSDHTANWSIDSFTGVEGDVLPIRLTNRQNGASVEISAARGVWFNMDAGDGLFTHRGSSDGVMTDWLYSADGTLLAAVPSMMEDTYSTGCVAGDALCLFAGRNDVWTRYALSAADLTAVGEPLTIQLPMNADVLALCGLADGRQLLALATATQTHLCTLSMDGTLLLETTLPGRALWAGQGDEGCLLLTNDPADNEFALHRLTLAE